MIYFPYKVTKGEALTVTLSLENYANEKHGLSPSDSQGTAVGVISKDGGTFVNTINTPSAISSGILTGDSSYIAWWNFKLTLTAEEMNADMIIVSFVKDDNEGTNKWDRRKSITIYTGTASGGVTAQEVWEYATREITGGGLSLTDTVTDITSLSDVNPTVREVLSFMWMYFTKRRKRGWWSLYRHLFRG